jgi:hypothetical protein
VIESGEISVILTSPTQSTYAHPATMDGDPERLSDPGSTRVDNLPHPDDLPRPNRSEYPVDMPPRGDE